MNGVKSWRHYQGVFFILLVIVLAAALQYPLLLAIGDFLILKDDLHPADIIHVISGPDYRADYGITLMKEGLARQIFFTGAWCPEIQDVHAERGKQRALSQGISPAAILTDSSDILSTYEEAMRLKVLIDESPIPTQSVIIVSDPFHMRRAKWTYRQILGSDIEIQMAPAPFESSPYQRIWWKDWASRRMVKEEYIKLVYYLARYGLNWKPLSAWLATFDTQ